MDYSTTSSARPVEHPNACDRCGSFRRVGERYEAPTAHFHWCRHFFDHGAIRMVRPAAFDRTTGKVRR
jgi:hypothetical protein